MTTKSTQTKENTLYLPIKQVYFDAILNGTKDKEYRNITPNTYIKYLETKKVEGGVQLYYIPELISEEKLELYANDFMYYNDGVFPYIPKDIWFLDLAVGYNKDRYTMTVEVTDISFKPSKDKEGNAAVISYDEEGKPYKDEQGEFTIWNIVFHLGEVVKKDLKRDRKN
ncbi:MAG TPA: hypothetical protein VLZ75_02890 [Chitinophagales bacterium]|nr:hypothetical protein [Chitinophagales bacterium]